ncbi:hypothetical protein SNEBB_002776 [Seison nebaliae]|nr:hypothetical protein SNEBB_002776 [Seison nebaliae]
MKQFNLMNLPLSSSLVVIICLTSIVFNYCILRHKHTIDYCTIDGNVTDFCKSTFTNQESSFCYSKYLNRPVMNCRGGVYKNNKNQILKNYLSKLEEVDYSTTGEYSDCLQLNKMVCLTSDRFQQICPRKCNLSLPFLSKNFPKSL